VQGKQECIKNLEAILFGDKSKFNARRDVNKLLFFTAPADTVLSKNIFRDSVDETGGSIKNIEKFKRVRVYLGLLKTKVYCAMTRRNNLAIASTDGKRIIVKSWKDLSLQKWWLAPLSAIHTRWSCD
jgi:hypothetical protein